MGKDERKTGIEGLEQLAEEIGAAGAKADTDVSEMRKAVKEFSVGFKGAMDDGIAFLKELRKGKGAPPMAGGDDEEEEDEDEPAAAPPKPGKPKPKPAADDADGTYPDTMAMGGGGGDEPFLDVSPLIRRIDAFMVANHGKDSGKAMVRLAKAMEQQNVLLAKVIEIQLGTTAPLAKGLQSLNERISDIPNTAPTMRERPGRNGLVRFGGEDPVPAPLGKLAGMTPAAMKSVLAKAQLARVLDETDVQQFQRTGRFDTDEKAHLQVLERVERYIS